MIDYVYNQSMGRDTIVIDISTEGYITWMAGAAVVRHWKPLIYSAERIIITKQASSIIAIMTIANIVSAINFYCSSVPLFGHQIPFFGDNLLSGQLCQKS